MFRLGLGGLGRGIQKLGPDRVREVGEVSLQDSEGGLPGRRIGHGRAGPDRGRIVAGHVREGQGHDPRRGRQPGEAAALHRRQMFAHAVDVGDRRPAAQKRPRHRLLVRQGHARRRRRQQGGGAARQQAEDEVVGAQTLDLRDQFLRGREPGFVQDRMGRLHHLDVAAGGAVAVGDDDQSRQGARPDILDRPGHRRRRFAGAHDHGAAARRLRQVRRHDLLGQGGLHGGVEKPTKNALRLGGRFGVRHHAGIGDRPSAMTQSAGGVRPSRTSTTHIAATRFVRSRPSRDEAAAWGVATTLGRASRASETGR